MSSRGRTERGATDGYYEIGRGRYKISFHGVRRGFGTKDGREKPEKIINVCVGNLVQRTDGKNQ